MFHIGCFAQKRSIETPAFLVETFNHSFFSINVGDSISHIDGLLAFLAEPDLAHPDLRIRAELASPSGYRHQVAVRRPAIVTTSRSPSSSTHWMVPSSPPKLCHLHVIARSQAQADVVHTRAHMEDVQIMRNGAGAHSCHGVYWLTESRPRTST